MKKQKHQGALGKALMNNLNKKNMYTPHDDMAVFFQKSERNEEFERGQRMKSIIERDSLTEFLVEAQMANKDFEADRNLKMKDIKEQLMSKRIKEPAEVLKEDQIYETERNKLLNRLRIPRKPKWTTADTKEQFVAKQNIAFLDWRRKLAQVEESQQSVKLTPFEKNIEVWRQLWRVVERSHVLVQIVDARDPLFFRCEDLDVYVKEVNPSKRSLLLINKSDLVGQEMREIWSDYLNKQGVSHVFFSAKVEQKKIDEEEEQKEKLQEQSEEDEDDDVVEQRGSILKQLKKQQKREIAELPKQPPTLQQLPVSIPFALNTPNLASVVDIISCIKSLADQLKSSQPKSQKPFQLQVGMVGYPNVGKSSVINSLLNKKKVGVASQPGKTKHYQTLYLTKDIVLVDCPGLVFPNVASTIAEMVLNGVIPIDNLREIYTPISLLVQRIPRVVIEEKEGVRFKDGIYNAETLLQGYANVKGFHTGRGLPNESQAARVILKDYTTGYLSHCKYPPGITAPVLPACSPLATSQPLQNQLKTAELKEKVLDTNFFDKAEEQVNLLSEVIKALTLDDILDLVDGKQVNGLKLKKNERKEIKFAVKRGEDVEQIKKKYLIIGAIVQEGEHKQCIRN